MRPVAALAAIVNARIAGRGERLRLDTASTRASGGASVAKRRGERVERARRALGLDDDARRRR